MWRKNDKKACNVPHSSNHLNYSFYSPRGYIEHNTSFPRPKESSSCRPIHQFLPRYQTEVGRFESSFLPQSLPSPTAPLPHLSNSIQQYFGSLILNTEKNHSKGFIGHKLSNCEKKNQDSQSMWIKKWRLYFEVKKREDISPVKVDEIQNLLIAYVDKLLLTKNAHEKLSDLKTSLNDEGWSALQHSAETEKNDLASLKKLIKNPSYISKAIISLSKRRHNRRRAKLNRHKKREKREQDKELSEKINVWRSMLVKQEMAKQQAEKINEEADNILAEVRGKLDETSKMKMLLLVLQKLRQYRITKGKAHGFITIPTADSFFVKMIEEISKMVAIQYNHYIQEKKTLHVMMEKSPNLLIGNSLGLNQLKSDYIEKWKEQLSAIYFGESSLTQLPEVGKQFYQSFVAAEDSFEILINRRMEWDQFLSDLNSPLSSCIPLEYVIPPSSPKVDWKLCLQDSEV